jgi:aldehyde:ferredoxin oxidoreductase
VTTGERIGTMRLAFNIREGTSPKKLSYPPIALGMPPLSDGPTKNITVDLETICREYYTEMDWDWATGKPTRRKLQELGLDWLAGDIWKD